LRTREGLKGGSLNWSKSGSTHYSRRC